MRPVRARLTRLLRGASFAQIPPSFSAQTGGEGILPFLRMHTAGKGKLTSDKSRDPRSLVSAKTETLCGKENLHALADIFFSRVLRRGSELE